MKLLINIGNSNICIGYLIDNDLKQIKIPINSNLENELQTFLNTNKNSFSKLIISSVNNEIFNLILPTLKSYFKDIKIVSTKDSDLIDFSKYKSNIGVDRFVCCIASLKYLKSPFIMIDFGTAITINVIDNNCNFIGGMILPGLSIALKSLSNNTSLLPYVNPLQVDYLLGLSTNENILSGIINGMPLMINGLIEKIFNQYKDMNFKVIVTGGDLKYIKSLLNFEFIYIEDLLLQGLLQICN